MIRPVLTSDSIVITKIHSKALAGDFLPSLGFKFLRTFYEGIVGKPGVYGFLFEEDGKIQGFVVGTRDSSNFFWQTLKSRFLQLALLLFIQIIRKPSLIKNVVETFLYPKKDAGVRAELVIIAVDRNYQGKGLGRQLVDALEEAFGKTGIKLYKLTVHANKKSVGFYEHLGYSRTAEFSLYGKMWYVYEKSIA